jgi:hypothetical protein
VVPNTALVAWIERQTGNKLGELFSDDEGTQPWRELNELMAAICRALELSPPEALSPETVLLGTPRSDDEERREPGLLPSAVLGLYPLSNQNVLRDLEAMAAGEVPKGPVESFLRVDVSLAPAEAAQGQSQTPAAARTFTDERLVTFADPCQARAVRFARESRGLVVHGPPGTGKSQTITNIVGDHLGRGQRVLFVCDKRTALDVVKNRLDHLGLGRLCAIVHDAQRDQRDLYMGVREQLDTLSDAKTNPAAITELAAVDAELAAIHDELTRYDQQLSQRPSDGESSFHELVGRWFSLAVPPELSGVRELEEPRLAQLGPAQKEVREVLERARVESFPTNLWKGILGIDLGGYLARPQADWNKLSAELADSALSVDGTAMDGAPSLDGGRELETQASERLALAERLEPLVKRNAAALLRWADKDVAALRQAKAQLLQLESLFPALEQPLDQQLALTRASDATPLPDLMLWIGKLLAFLQIARKWYRWFCFGRKRAALEVLQRFGLLLGADSALRTHAFLEGSRARRLLGELYERTLAPGQSAASLSDAELHQQLIDHLALFEVLISLDERAELGDFRRRMTATTAALLRQSAVRARGIDRLGKQMEAAGLFSDAFRARIDGELRAGGKIGLFFQGLQERVGSVEGILRIERTLGSLPATLAEAVRHLADHAASADDGWNAVERAVLAAEIGRRLRSQPQLQSLDGERLQAHFTRYRALENHKRQLARDSILHIWTARQRERLLASTGTRLNAAGAELRRRLTLRGERAMRVRQVIASGQAQDGGDPLFDLRPMWMASPETVAQIFPRLPIFDVVVFDEASQCRLEEALPVMTRASRVVIAGDPKQLPPTRFFESAIAQSNEGEIENDQQLFEEQQAEVEDLLGAALNLEIEQCYLDVHYRSRNADLIEFSNRSFYDSRLQAIPGHPKNRAVQAPLKLIHVEGAVYEKRSNPAEAKAVVRLLQDLLKRDRVPSVGIACFNLTQRDTILEAIEEAAAADGQFATRLAEARNRRGAGSFEGLFVKNLENVQGDERDHIIISTTYGPDPKGRFYRRFGPLGQPGGGRRLNVLVTRAREEVHLVTSIPKEIYRALPPVEPGKVPNGGWLLFSYLGYAESLARIYEEEAARYAESRVERRTTVRVRESSCDSTLARALAARLAEEGGVSSDVHWGNDGFAIDVALHHPRRAEDVTIGLVCDGTRFDKAADRVEWDLFRVAVLEGQGWQIHRIWSPQLFRDPEAALRAVQARIDAFLAADTSVDTRILQSRERQTGDLPN